MSKICSLVQDEKDLGHIFRFKFENYRGLQLQAYSWQVGNPKGLLVLLHGLGAHALHDFLQPLLSKDVLKNRSPEQIMADYKLALDNSFVQKCNYRSFSVFTYDHQGHGLSSAWKNEVCNMESFNDLTFDSLHFLIHVHKTFNMEKNLPIFLGGISMGGLVALKTTELYKYILEMGTLPVSPLYKSLTDTRKATMISTTTPVHKMILPQSRSTEEVVSQCRKLPLKGVVYMCPAISVGNVKNALLNRIIFPLGSLMSNYFPNARIVSKVSNKLYPWMDDLKNVEGSLLYTGKLACRIMIELLNAGQTAKEDATLLYDEVGKKALQFLFVHAKEDDLCDFNDTKNFVQKITPHTTNTKLVTPPDMWHYLLAEPGSNVVAEEIVNWIESFFA